MSTSVTPYGVQELNKAYTDLLETIAGIEENEADRLGMRHSPTAFMNQVRNQLGGTIGEAYDQFLTSEPPA